MAVNEISGVRALPKPNITIHNRWLHKRQWSTFHLLLVSGALFVSLLILLVPAYLILRAFTGWENAVETLVRPQTWQVLLNTLGLALAVNRLRHPFSHPAKRPG